MKTRSKLFFAALLASATLVSGCGGGDSSTANSSVAVTPSLGLVSGATVNLYQADGTTLLGTATIGADGSVTIDYSGSYTGPVVVEVLGNSNAQYYDEALGAFAPFGPGSSVHALVPSGVTTIGVTALTEVAWQLAAAQNLSLDDQTITTINQRVRDALAPELTDILGIPRLYDSNITTGSLGDNQADRYALRLAALAQIGNDNNGGGDPSPALRAMRQLGQDLSDGTLDGQVDGTPITDPAYSAGSLAAAILTKMGAVAQAVGNTALQGVITNYAGAYGNAVGNIDLSNLGTGSGGGSGCDSACQQIFADNGGVTHPFIPDTSSLKDALATEFDGAASYDVTIGTNGTITLNGDTTAYEFTADEITSYAVSANETNIFYTDAATGYEVILQATDSGLSLNIAEPYTSGADINTLDNALLEYSDTGSGSAPSPTGDGAALAGGNGATGSIDSTTYTYTGAGALAPAYQYIPTNDTGDFRAYGSNVVTEWRVVGFPATAGTYSCGTNGNLPEVRLTLNGTPYTTAASGGACTIEVSAVSSTAVEGRFAATLVGASGNVFGTATDGYFRYADNSGGTGGTNTGLAAGSYGAVFDLGGSAYDWSTTTTSASNTAIAITGLGAERYLAFLASQSYANSIQLRMLPIDQTGSYTCGQGPNSYRLVGVWLNVAGVAYKAEDGINGSSCSIDVTSAGTTYEGTFSGTFVDSSGNSVTVTNGQFRNDGSQL